MWRGLLRGLLVINGLAAVVAAAVLTVSPETLPLLAGLSFAGEAAALLARLLAGAELAIAAVCLLALRTGKPAAERSAGMVLVVLHAATALALLGWVGSSLVAANVALRIALVVLLLAVMRRG